MSEITKAATTQAEFLRLIDTQLAARQFDLASETLKQAYDADPSAPEVRLREALLNQQQGRLEAAAQTLQRLASDYPAFIRAKAQLLNTLLLADRLIDIPENQELVNTVLEHQNNNFYALKAQLSLALQNTNSREHSNNIEEALRISLKHHPFGYQFIDICIKKLSPPQVEHLFNNCSDIPSPALKLRNAQRLIRRNTPKAALLLLSQAYDISSEHLPVIRSLLHLLIDLDKHDEFSNLIEASSIHLKSEEEVIKFKLLSLLKQRKFHEAITLSKSLKKHPNLKPETIDAYIQLILKINKVDEFKYILESFGNKINPIQQCEIYYRLGDFSSSLHKAEQAMQKRPDVQSITAYYQSLRALGEQQRGIDTLEQGIKQFKSISLYGLLIKANAETGNKERCIQLLEIVENLFKKPKAFADILHSTCMILRSDLGMLEKFKLWANTYKSPQYITYYIDILRICGQHHEANQIDNKFQVQPTDFDRKLNLITELQKISLDNANHLTPASCFAWIKADKTQWQFIDWYGRARWGQQANRLFTKAFSTDCSQIEPDWDQYPLINTDMSPITSLLSKKKGLVIASSHRGPVAASMVAMKRAGISTRIIATTGRSLEPHFRTSFLTEQPHTAIKQLIASLKDNEAIISSPDLSKGKGGIEFDFMHGKLTLAPIMPRLCYRNRTPSLWMKAYWTEANDIAIEFRELPSPEPEELESAFIERWGKAYLDLLEQQLCGDPANIGFSEEWRSWAIPQPGVANALA
ncbi:tetratricopeptide repeat protein [Oceanobacter mangrovi]|uniref:tetratricopeptide repeat protein n=1 Tax=Oceanobacter mangrovi TaxID=2862510 RepID=UPI001C8DDD47|nr:hypothetical protein [Oceanobacter mangrovi]